MTKQEAVDLIKLVPLYRYECELEKGRRSDLFEALNLAIKALEKQIAVQDVLERLRKKSSFNELWSEAAISLDDAIEIVKEGLMND